MSTLIEKCDRDGFISHFHGFRDNHTKQWEVSGRTLYLASPQSEVYFCIYDKAFEHTRYTLRLRLKTNRLKFGYVANALFPQLRICWRNVIQRKLYSESSILTFVS
ncbi:replication initiation factor domain-containing protein [Secundilactobacillus folii]|uniref:replication initiation factor domain-containing protein n=1 Tax=Secundilactobacillus folii TaxID=2678357 RepID=UPI0031B589E9